MLVPCFQDRRRDVPPWLAQIRDTQGKPPLLDMLASSLYYANSGNEDGDPVKYLGGYIHSFVFADSDEHKAPDETMRVLQGERAPQGARPFNGYKVVDARCVGECELVRDQRQPVPSEDRHLDPVPYGEHVPRWWWSPQRRAVWAILQREEELDEDHGARRFSFLSVHDDSQTAFFSLYCRNGVAPDVLAIINPGYGSDLRDPNSSFAGCVRKNAGGMPRFLLSDCTGEQGPFCDWPEYRRLVCDWQTAKHRDGDKRHLALWERSPERGC